MTRDAGPGNRAGIEMDLRVRCGRILQPFLIGGLVSVALTVAARGQQEKAPNPCAKILELVADVPMPGPAVRFDYQSMDAQHGRLYIAHMNADQLVVFDTAKRAVVANLDGFKRVHGVIAVPEIGRVFARKKTRAATINRMGLLLPALVSSQW